MSMNKNGKDAISDGEEAVSALVNLDKGELEGAVLPYLDVRILPLGLGLGESFINHLQEA